MDIFAAVGVTSTSLPPSLTNSGDPVEWGCAVLFTNDAAFAQLSHFTLKPSLPLQQPLCCTHGESRVNASSVAFVGPISSDNGQVPAATLWEIASGAAVTVASYRAESLSVVSLFCATGDATLTLADGDVAASVSGSVAVAEGATVTVSGISLAMSGQASVDVCAFEARASSAASGFRTAFVIERVVAVLGSNNVTFWCAVSPPAILGRSQLRASNVTFISPAGALVRTAGLAAVTLDGLVVDYGVHGDVTPEGPLEGAPEALVVVANVTLLSMSRVRQTGGNRLVGQSPGGIDGTSAVRIANSDVASAYGFVLLPSVGVVLEGVRLSRMSFGADGAVVEAFNLTMTNVVVDGVRPALSPSGLLAGYSGVGLFLTNFAVVPGETTARNSVFQNITGLWYGAVLLNPAVVGNTTFEDCVFDDIEVIAPEQILSPFQLLYGVDGVPALYHFPRAGAAIALGTFYIETAGGHVRLSRVHMRDMRGASVGGAVALFALPMVVHDAAGNAIVVTSSPTVSVTIADCDFVRTSAESGGLVFALGTVDISATNIALDDVANAIHVGDGASLDATGLRALNVSSALLSIDGNSRAHIATVRVLDADITGEALVSLRDSAVLAMSDVIVENARGSLPGSALLSATGSASANLTDVSISVLSGVRLWAGVDSSSVLIANVTLVDVSLVGSGIIEASGASSVTVRDARALRVYTSGSGGLLFAKESATAHFYGVISIEGMSVGGSGGAVHLEGGAWLTMDVSLSATNVHAGASGGVLSLAGQSYMRLGSADVVNAHSAEDGGVVHVTDSAHVVIDSLTASHTSAGESGGLVYADASSVFELAAIVSVDSVAIAGSGGVLSVKSDSRLSKLGTIAVSAARAARDGGFLDLEVYRDSEYRIDGLTVDDVAAVRGACISVTGAVTLSVANATFSNVHAAGSGGVLCAGQSSTVSLSHVDAFRVTAARGGLVALTDTAVVHVHAATVRGASAAWVGGLAALVYESSLALSNSAISGVSAEKGGVIYATDDATVQFNSSVVTDVVASSGAVALAEGTAAVFMRNLDVSAAVAHVDGGALALSGSAVMMASDLTFARVYADVAGGVAWLDGGATLRANGVSSVLSNSSRGGFLAAQATSKAMIQDCDVDDSSSADEGGCFYADGGAKVAVSGGRYSHCRAGTTSSASGAGGFAFAGGGSLLTLSSPVTVDSPAAILGTCVYSETILGIETLANLRIVGNASLVSGVSELPGWSPGGTCSSAPRSVEAMLADTSVRPEVTSGGVVPTLFVRLLDAYGVPVSSGTTRQVSIRLSVKSSGGAAQLRGDLERNFGSSASVTFSGVRLYSSTTGLHQIVAESTNPFVYGSFDTPENRAVLSTMQFNVTVNNCTAGYVIVTGADGLPECVPLPAHGGSRTTAIAVASAVSASVVVAALAVGFFLWRRSVVLLQQSKATHQEFLEKHVAKSDTLAEMELSRESVEMLERLGDGEFGVVCRARVVLADGRPRVCAAKTMKPGATYESRCDFVSEATVMGGLMRHPHVVSLVGVLLREEPMVIVLEYVPYGSLLSFVREIPAAHRVAGSASLRMLESFCRHIALGMAYLATVGVVHRDLAARNCMVGQDAFGEYLVKVADFGLSGVTATGKDYYRKGRAREKLPVKWIAPEAIADRRFTQASDVWAYGVTAWEIFSFGDTPYPGITVAAIVAHVRQGGRLERPSLCSQAFFRAVVEPCWSESPDDRPTFQAIADKLIPSVAHDQQPHLKRATEAPAADAGYLQVLVGSPKRRSSQVPMVALGVDGYVNLQGTKLGEPAVAVGVDPMGALGVDGYVNLRGTKLEPAVALGVDPMVAPGVDPMVALGVDGYVNLGAKHGEPGDAYASCV